MSATKIAVYSVPDLKNTTDDALTNYLTSLGFHQSHMLTDVRLGLGYLAVLISGVLFAYDNKYGWEASKGYTLWVVIAYFVLNGAFTLWILFAEKGKVFIGERNGVLVSIASSTTKNSPTYKLTVRVQDQEQSVPFDWDVLQIQAPFTRWFTADGHFVAAPLQQWLAGEIPLVSKAVETASIAKEKKLDHSSAKTTSSESVQSPTAGTKPRKAKK